MRDLGFRCGRHVDFLFGIDELDMVRVDGEARVRLADVIRDDQIAALRGELRARVLEHVLGLGREPDEQRRAPLALLAELGEQIGIRDELDRRLRTELAALELFFRFARGPVVGDRRGHHDHVGTLRRVAERALQLRRALDMMRGHPHGRRHRTRPEQIESLSPTSPHVA